MSATLLDGRVVASKILESLKPRVKALNPTLVIVQVGEDPASTTYIQAKLKACSEIGMRTEHRKFPTTLTAQTLIEDVHRLNADPDTTGYIIQLPLPDHLWKAFPMVVREIDPRKDVDGFTAYNLGKVVLSTEFEHLPPATPLGVIELLDFYSIPIEGRHAVVVGASNIVGKPLAAMLLNRGATVTVCHIKTKDLASHTRQADILVSAVGKPKLITPDMVKEGAVVIDVGISKTPHGIRGDVDFEAVSKVASWITPVPGGVGPMTVACLLRNVIGAKERQLEKV